MTQRNQYVSPTGSTIVGTKELIVGITHIAGIEADGTPIPGNRGTLVIWDDMETVTQDGKIVFIDGNGAEWTFDQLKLVADGPADAAGKQ